MLKMKNRKATLRRVYTVLLQAIVKKGMQQEQQPSKNNQMKPTRELCFIQINGFLSVILKNPKPYTNERNTKKQKPNKQLKFEQKEKESKNKSNHEWQAFCLQSIQIWKSSESEKLNLKK